MIILILIKLSIKLIDKVSQSHSDIIRFDLFTILINKNLQGDFSVGYNENEDYNCQCVCWTISSDGPPIQLQRLKMKTNVELNSTIVAPRPPPREFANLFISLGISLGNIWFQRNKIFIHLPIFTRLNNLISKILRPDDGFVRCQIQ